MRELERENRKRERDRKKEPNICVSCNNLQTNTQQGSPWSDGQLIGSVIGKSVVQIPNSATKFFQIFQL